MSKKNKNPRGWLDREMPQLKKQTRFGEVKFKLGGKIPDGWTIRDFLWFLGFLAAFAIPLMLMEYFGIFEKL